MNWFHQNMETTFIKSGQRFSDLGRLPRHDYYYVAYCMLTAWDNHLSYGQFQSAQKNGDTNEVLMEGPMNEGSRGPSYWQSHHQHLFVTVNAFMHIFISLLWYEVFVCVYKQWNQRWDSRLCFAVCYLTLDRFLVLEQRVFTLLFF